MATAPPPNEALRQQSLEQFDVLDTDAEKSFDDLTRLVARICDVPISLVSLIDRDRQWFKSRYGLDLEQTPRDQAFCDHAIRCREVMVVPDATADARFADNPLVIGQPHIAFYAGAPLEVDPELRLGTLCVIDVKPRELETFQLEALEILRDCVVNLLELRRSKGHLVAVGQLLPMCAWCRNVRVERDGESVWRPLHEYVMQSVVVTHGICPACMAAALNEP